MTSPSELPETSTGSAGTDPSSGATTGESEAAPRRRDLRSKREAADGDPDQGDAPTEVGTSTEHSTAEQTAVTAEPAAAEGGEAGGAAAPATGDETAADATTGDETGTTPDPAAAKTSRNRRMIILIGAVVALLVVALVALLLTRNAGQRDPMNVVTITRQADAPTPSTDPIERDKSTPLLEALPDTVADFAVTEQAESGPMLEAFALEGWTLTYTGNEAVVVLQVGQWPTADEATGVFDDLVGDATASAEGDVTVAGETVGTFVTYAVDGGTDRTVWRNGTAVFVAEGPTGATQTFYDAFPF